MSGNTFRNFRDLGRYLKQSGRTADTPADLVRRLERLGPAVFKRVGGAFNLAGLDFVGTVQARFRQRSSPQDDWLQNRSGRLRGSIQSRLRAGGSLSGDASRFLAKGAPVPPGALSSLELVLFSAGVPYAKIQEYGGEVAPKNVRNLTIPMPAALTKAGVPRFTAREFLEANRDAFFLTDRKNRTWIVKPKVRRGKRARQRAERKTTLQTGRRALSVDDVRSRRDRIQGLKTFRSFRDLRRDLKQRDRTQDLEFFFLLVPRPVRIPPRLKFHQTWRDLESKRKALLARAVEQAVADTAEGGA